MIYLLKTIGQVKILWPTFCFHWMRNVLRPITKYLVHIKNYKRSNLTTTCLCSFLLLTYWKQIWKFWACCSDCVIDIVNLNSFHWVFIGYVYGHEYVCSLFNLVIWILSLWWISHSTQFRLWEYNNTIEIIFSIVYLLVFKSISTWYNKCDRVYIIF